MEDSEKLTALKKAYADIILNTAKEAASRIMLSERKAMRFQQELASAKEEALRMLLRLKQMLDSKVKEAEFTSLSQQKKIDELEAQLQEAEEIVRDLRAELREAQAELENVANHQMYPSVEQKIKGEATAQRNCLRENRPCPYDPCVHSVPDSQLESVSNSKTGSPTVNGTNDSSEFCVSHDHTNSCYIHNPDFASIVIRRKEPELYRNGCTQRIRAFERSLFDGNIPVSGNLDNVQDETLVRVLEEGKAMPVTTNAEADIVCEKEKPDELKVVNLHNRKRIVRVHEGKAMPVTTNAKADIICEKKKPKPRYLNLRSRKSTFRVRKAVRSRLHSDQVKETNKASNLSFGKGSPSILGNKISSRGNSSTVENEDQKDPMSPSFAEETINKTATVEQSRSHNDTEKGEAFLNACSALNKIEDKKELLDKSDLTRQVSLSTANLEVPACTANVEAANGSPNKLDQKASDLDEKASGQPVNDKFLKYTFRRKRKKEFVSSTHVDCSLENSNSKKKCGEKENGHAEPQKLCPMTETSRDSRRLAQVARQLISLSEKKWWQ